MAFIPRRDGSFLDDRDGSFWYRTPSHAVAYATNAGFDVSRNGDLAFRDDVEGTFQLEEKPGNRPLYRWVRRNANVST